MVALMASIAGGCQGRGNLKPAPSLGLRGGCHYCHLFYKSSKKIKIKEFFQNTWQHWQRPSWTQVKFDRQIGAHIALIHNKVIPGGDNPPPTLGEWIAAPDSACLESDQEGNWVKSYSEKRKVTPISWLIGISPISQLPCLQP
jgi:hypothetical protein